MAFGTLLWRSVILTSVTLLLRDIAGIGSAPRIFNRYEQRMMNKDGNFRPGLWAMMLSMKFSEAIQDKKAYMKHSNKYSF